MNDNELMKSKKEGRYEQKDGRKATILMHLRVGKRTNGNRE